jgi:hypothetical protein
MWRLIRRAGGSWAATIAVAGLCAAPASVVFQVAYTESLVLLLVLCAAWATRERRYGVLFAVAVAIAFARPVVLALALAIILHGMLRWRRRDQEPFPTGQVRTVGLLAVGCALLFGAWPLCAWLGTGEPRAYLLTQAAWPEPPYDGVAPSWLLRSVQGEPVAVLVLLCGLVVSLGLLVAKWARVWSEELRVFSASYVAMVLLVVSPGTFATLRYALPTAVGWWPFPTLGANRSVPVRAALVMLLITIGAFLQGWWILWFWIIGPHHHYHP